MESVTRAAPTIVENYEDESKGGHYRLPDWRADSVDCTSRLRSRLYWCS